MKAQHPWFRIFLAAVVAGIFSTNVLQAQSKKGKGKYPGLLWEITGKGIKKPSYLFGTMHVSSKMAFHLSDSFYHALKGVEVVALETNPENWQDDFTRSKYLNMGSDLSLNRYENNSGLSVPEDYLSINTFAIPKYEKGIARALSAQPEIINSLLYRNFTGAEDFEEDTFLDMYIFQVGRKLGKKITGVEDFEESQKLVLEAYRDAALDKNAKRRTYDFNDNYADPLKLQEAYRKGDLDLLDSINKLNTFSDAFQEKFLYKRNDIQASSIDSIIQSGTSLFVGVGAAHLPGSRGVIEWLRKKGYTLRPVMMGERDSYQKEVVDKIRIPLKFTRQWTEDSLFSVELPGKLYRFTPQQLINQVQFADMVNGAYYMVTRLKTNAALWGHDSKTVYKKVDSLLYENVPGKIVSRKEIKVNGYPALDIINKTRRGDYQRYQIIITPYEIFFFKMSGNGDFVITGDEAKKFFESISIKENHPANWIAYTPPYGGFTVQVPATPVISKVYATGPDRYDYEVVDEKNGNDYRIMKTAIHNMNFIEEDSFDLGLIEESFASSGFIDKTLSRKQTVYKGYPALEVKYKHTDGSITQARFLLQGPHYFALLAHGKKEIPEQQTFLNSFVIKPFVYPAVKARIDTSLFFSVNSPIYPEPQTEAQIWMKELMKSYADENNRYPSADFPEVFNSITVGNDTIGEKIAVIFYKLPKYQYLKDSSLFWEKGQLTIHDSDFIYRQLEKRVMPHGMINYNIQMQDTNSSRLIKARLFYKEGVVHMIVALTDTLSTPSTLMQNFFETFTPADTLKGYSPFVKKSELFFADYYSPDSATRKKALRYLSNMYFDSTDLPRIQKAIAALSWNDKDYLDRKKDWIEKVGGIEDSHITAYLLSLYKEAGDTIELQNSILAALLQQKTQTAYDAFKKLMLEEPPVILSNEYRSNKLKFDRRKFGPNVLQTQFYFKKDLFDQLYDSAQLTKSLFPDFLTLLTLDDYKPKMMELLGNMVDSGLLKATDYQEYYNKFWLEAKLEWRKQSILENTKAIEKKQEAFDNKSSDPYNLSNLDDEDNKPNDALDLYAVLLLPFWDRHENIPLFYTKLLQSTNNRIKYNTALLLLRNHKPVSDTLWKYFAGQDDYRTELFDDLAAINQIEKFPIQFKTQAFLARANLIVSRDYIKADTVVYLDKLPLTYKNQKGWVYFYKYKDKKDDAGWKLASSGMQPENPKEVSTDDEFVSFRQDKLDEDKPLKLQLQQLLKQMLNTRRKSAKNFYDKGNNFGNLFGMSSMGSTEDN